MARPMAVRRTRQALAARPARRERAASLLGFLKEAGSGVVYFGVVGAMLIALMLAETGTGEETPTGAAESAAVTLGSRTAVLDAAIEAQSR